MARTAAISLALATLALVLGDVAPTATAVETVDRAASFDTRGPATQRWIVAAAGDIACANLGYGSSQPNACQHDATGELVARSGVDLVLALGDNQYDVGAFREYSRYFDATWGQAFARIRPVPGNHEYAQDVARRPRGYFRYFGDRVKGPHGQGYYSFEVGACPGDPCWHVVALNSQLCFAAGGCGRGDGDPGRGNRMYRWLRRDLARHPDERYPCTIATFHHPRFSFSTGSGATSAVAPLWQLLYDAGADIVLNGHSHNYQRWRPQTPSGAADPDRGIRQFIVGTGGASLYALRTGERPRNLVAAQDEAFGVLQLSLKPAGYRWAFVTADGQPRFEDTSRVVPCARA